MNNYYIGAWSIYGAYLVIRATDYTSALQLAVLIMPNGDFSLWEEGDLP